MTPAECLAQLWEQAEIALAQASSTSSPEKARRGAVIYERRQLGWDGGDYNWNNGMPRIKLFRSVSPTPYHKPDLLTSPEADACHLAHELGHFLSDKDGSRTQPAYDVLRAGEALTGEQKNLILAEERNAWRLGRQELAALGWNSWMTFEALESASIHSYEDGLAGRPTADA